MREKPTPIRLDNLTDTNTAINSEKFYRSSDVQLSWDTVLPSWGRSIVICYGISIQ